MPKTDRNLILFVLVVIVLLVALDGHIGRFLAPLPSLSQGPLVATEIVPEWVPRSTLYETLSSGSVESVPMTVKTELSSLEFGSASDTFAHLASLSGYELGPIELQASEAEWLQDVPEELRPALAVLWGGRIEAEREVQLAFEGLTQEDMTRLEEERDVARERLRAVVEGSASQEDTQKAKDYYALASRVKLNHIARAQLILLKATERNQEMLRDVKVSATYEGKCAEGSIIFETNDCRVIIGGDGTNIYPDKGNSVNLLVDLGGQDRYYNSPGGNPYEFLSAAVALDRGTDNDTYNTTKESGLNLTGTQGSGRWGVGVLVDEGGDDLYFSTIKIAQGSGNFGAGTLWDQGSGRDVYDSGDFAQGSGSPGFGLLIDEGGTDSYTVKPDLNAKGAQGTGCNGGFGALIDRGSESDVYDAGAVDAQGMGCIASLGILFDGGGSDRFVLHPIKAIPGFSNQPQKVSGYGQGYGELGAVGILFDESGDDFRKAEVTDGVQDEGQLVHGAGLLGGIGILVDVSGNDRYESRRLSQGAGDAGVGIILEEEGDDQYITTEGKCQGYGKFGGLGVLLDNGGEDLYVCSEPAFPEGRGNNKIWTFGTNPITLGGGIGIDRG